MSSRQVPTVGSNFQLQHRLQLPLTFRTSTDKQAHLLSRGAPQLRHDFENREDDCATAGKNCLGRLL
ncbi:hypothetical protein DTO282F9_7164 [Paecilomyces variotii]|nr:hypothetical protein DTO282F9_7164 [Paecilomyces variotii]